MSLAEANAILEAQRAELTGDAELRREAAAWTDATPEECLAATYALCAEGDHFLSLLTPEQLERAIAPEPFPDSTLAILGALCAHPR